MDVQLSNTKLERVVCSSEHIYIALPEAAQAKSLRYKQGGSIEEASSRSANQCAFQPHIVWMIYNDDSLPCLTKPSGIASVLP